MPSRRDVLRAGGFVAAAAMVGGGAGGVARAGTAAGTAPDLAARIKRSVRRPVFPGRTFPITRYGARPGGTTDCTDAIRRAIADCHEAGGGRVLVPSGAFLTGAIHLQSNVDLHLAADSRLLFSTDLAAYPAVYTRWQGIECYNYSPFIYAYGQRNIAITGSGTLDGQAGTSYWWPWTGNPEYGYQPGGPTETPDWTALQQLAADGVPVADRKFGPGHYLRPNFVQPYNCRNVLIEGITVLASPMWELHPVLCDNVIISDVTVDSHGPNNDGCDPESCSNVLITGCSFSTGDDCIAVKSGRNADGRRVNVPSQNILVESCTFADGHGGITIGSEMSGGVRNVVGTNLSMSSPNLEIALRLKTNSLRGGYIEDIQLLNSTVGQVSDSFIQIDFHYENQGPGGGFNPTVDRITTDGITVGSCGYPWYLRGYPDDSIQNLTVRNTSIATASEDSVVEYVEGLVLENVTVNGKAV